MHKKKSKLRERTQLVFIYGLMTLAILSLLTALVLVIQGYRYNRFDGRIEQGGLVQFNSRPTGATVSVDGIKLSNKTASKITLTAGTHDVTMSRDGYNDWTKTVTVLPGEVLWLNYARLFPTKPQVSVAAKYETVSSAIVSADRNWMAIIANPTAASVSLVQLNTDTPNALEVAIPAAEVTVPTDATTQRFSLVSWDKDSQSVLLRHDYDGKVEFIVVNARGDHTAYNLSARLGVSASRVEFSDGDSKVLYLLTDTHELRRANISTTTLSGPLATNVSDFAAANQPVVTYATTMDAAGRRSVGYISGGNSTAKQLASYAIADSVPLLARVGTYYGDRYVVIAHGDTVDISMGSLPASDSSDAIATKAVASLAVGTSTTYLGFSPNDSRMVYVQSSDKIVTYDLELDAQATITPAGRLARQLTWIDGFHIATTIGTTATYSDYDGTNSQTVSTKAIDLPLAVSSDDKYLYYFTTNGTTTTLSRVKML